MSKRTQCKLEQLEAREVPSSTDLIAVGGQPSGIARLYNADGTLQFQVRPFTTPKPVAVQVAVGDVTGDGTPDLITAVGLRSGARVKIYNGTDGSKVAGFAAFPAALGNRVSVTAADFNGDGRADIAIAAGQRPRIKIVDGQTLSVLESFSVPPWSRGGVRLTTGDVDGDGAPELIAAHAVGAPRVIIYDGSQLIQPSGTPSRLVPDFFPFASSLRTGVQVAAADVNNDGFSDLIFGGGGNGRQVSVWDGQDFALSDGVDRVKLLSSTINGSVASRGVRVGSTDVNGDDQADVLVANGMRQTGTVQAYLSSDFTADPTVVVSLSGFSTSSFAATHDAPVAVSAPRILLTPGKLATLRQQAVANTAQWQAFKQRLDQGLTRVLNSSQYQASSLGWIADYSLGYQVLKESDPTTAANYADKAIALMKSGLRDYQQGWAPRQFLARGDGTTKTYTLANADILPSSVRVYVGPVTTETITRGTATSDSITWYSHILKVSNTADGAATYIEGVNWWRNPMLRNNQLDWSLSGNEPAAGATYYVTSAVPPSASSKAFTLSGNTITLTVAPGVNEAVFVEYIYGTRSQNGSTLAFQQTGAGQGGFTSIYMDTNYASRNLGKNIAIGYDWLQDYVGLSPALRAEAAELLVKWNDWLRDSGFRTYGPANNYGQGTYVSRMLSAIALSGGRDENGDRLLGEMTQYRHDWILPLLENPSQSHKGGFWSEGWAYGDGASRNLLLAGLAFEQAGFGTANAERTWASQVIRHLITAQPTQTSVYDGGEGAYPRPLPSNDLFCLLATMDTDATTRAYANYIIQSRPESNASSFTDLLYRDPSAPASFWSEAPLQHRAEGTELVVARADWTYDSTWLAFQLGNLVSAFAPGPPGHFQLQRGADNLLINANAYGGSYATHGKSTYANLILIDDNGDGVQNYRYGMGVWFGTPGVVTTAYEAADAYLYVAGDYHAAYSHSSKPGVGGPTSELTRQVVYLRPDFVIVHDRATTIKDTYLKQLQWHFLNVPTLSGNSWVETVGNSKLFGRTFSTQPLTTTVQQVAVNSKTVSQVTTKNANPTASIRYVTALQSAESTTTSMVATQQVVSADGRMEGVQMGNELVLFGTNGAVDAANPVTYTATGTGTVSHLLTDMQAGRTYQLRVNGANVGTVRASGQGTVSFSTAAGSTVTLT